MKTALYFVLAGLLAWPAALPAQDDGKNVPDVATLEVQRRGNLVERLGTKAGNSVAAEFIAAMAPPADDSHKWFISLVVKDGCAPCAKLKADMETAPPLRAFVNPQDHTKSWAHYNVFRWEDATQQWRWRGITVRGLPTLLIQPPRNGQYGDCKSVVWQKTGYDGDPEKLAQDLRRAIYQYVAALKRPVTGAIPVQGFRQAGVLTGPPPGYDATSDAASAEKKQRPGLSQLEGYAPPFPPVAPNPTPAPVLPPEWPPLQPAPAGPASGLGMTIILGLLGQLMGGLFGSEVLQNLLLGSLVALAAKRTFRPGGGTKAGDPASPTADRSRLRK